MSLEAGGLIALDGAELRGELVVPKQAYGAVVFAHGSGSSHLSPRNRLVATELQSIGCATLLIDLLTYAEARDRRRVFDVQLLADRLLLATDWLREQGAWGGPIGFYGASTGSAGAVQAAVLRPASVDAIVSRGGRPDLVGKVDLARLDSPTLLIVGADDPLVLAVNREADRVLQCEHRLEIVPGASHLFEEEGALEEVARLARDWFSLHLAGRKAVSD